MHIQDYPILPDHEKAMLRRQLAIIGSPLRRGALVWLNERYQEYREVGGELVALAWAGEILPADLWNCLFAASYRMGSYGCPAVLLAKKDGRYRAVYKRK